jgi:hypothetical protein
MTDETKPSKQELIAILDELIQGMENLPPHALVMPITHYDHWQLMILISQIFKAEK